MDLELNETDKAEMMIETSLFKNAEIINITIIKKELGEE